MHSKPWRFWFSGGGSKIFNKNLPKLFKSPKQQLIVHYWESICQSQNCASQKESKLKCKIDFLIMVLVQASNSAPSAICITPISCIKIYSSGLFVFISKILAYFTLKNAVKIASLLQRLLRVPGSCLVLSFNKCVFTFKNLKLTWSVIAYICTICN
jgi:hypothetical protein